MTTFKPGDPVTSPAPTGVRLSDYANVLEQIVPGVEVSDAPYGPAAHWSLRADLGRQRAVNEEHAIQMMRAFGEQIRARVIREMGVQPILDGYRAEVDEFRSRNKSLEFRLATAHNRIAALEDRIAEMVDDDD